MTINKTLESLCTAFGPTGRETEIAEVIKTHIEKYADSITQDVMGNLIAVKKGSIGKKKIMLAAHMDEIGLIVTHIDDNGYLRVASVGGVNPQRSMFHRVKFENGMTGVLGHETKDFSIGKMKIDHLFIDIGATNKEEAQKLVQVGDIAKFSAPFVTMGDRVSSPALDNRVGCVVLIDLISKIKGNEDDIYFVFTSQEEVGLRGAKTAAFSIMPDLGIALDVTPAGDTPESTRLTVDVGKGPAIKIKDRSLICNPVVVQLLLKAAEEAKVKAQREVLEYGGTDSGAIQTTAHGVLSGVISIPCRYVHSQSETVDVNDIKGAVKILEKLLGS
ncbi:MAG: M42 family metallopeptidase [Clostridiales bacterium]|nr:M42 family metallopeptidase [Clostridiales bacterium]